MDKTKLMLMVVIGMCAVMALVTVQSALRAAPQAKKETSTKSVTIKGSFVPHSTAMVAPTGISGAVKLCSGVQAPNWRDTITVPDSWTPEACRGFAASIGTSQPQLGCAQANSISWGNPGGGTPSPNCGW
jgi:hypothetical protein